MSAGWTTKRFGDVLDIRNGKNQREVESTDGEYPILGSAGKIMGYATEYICEAGTTIIGRKGTINSPIFSETRFWNVDTAFGLSPRTDLDTKYLYYFCESYDFDQHNRGTTIPSLVKSDLLGIEIPLPPLEEQRRIVAVLDEAFAAIATATANAEKNLANADLLGRQALRSLLEQHADDWDEVEIREIADVESGAGFPEHLQGKMDEAYPFFKVGDMNTLGNEVTMTVANHSISESIRTQLRARLFPVGSVVFPKVGGAIATDKKRLIGRQCCVDNNVMGIIPKPGKLDASLLHQLLKNKHLSEFANDAGLPSIRKSTVEAWRVRLPRELGAQRQMAEQLSNIDASARELATVYSNKLNTFKQLKQSLLQRAFSGELTTKDLIAA